MAKNPRLIDMTGLRVGLWTVVRQDGNSTRGGALWRCVCDCGNVAQVTGADLRAGKSRSCGCVGSRKQIGALRRTHGATGSRLYVCWQNMRRRCADRDNPDYGGRGISICEEWSDFERFQDWALASGYRDDLTIERRDVNGNYDPSNCEWADATTQAQNRRFVAKTPTGILWVHVAEANGISSAAYRSRISDGWDYEEAATWPMNRKRRDGNLKRAVYLTVNGEQMPATLAAKALGYSGAAVYQRAKRMGVSLQEALDSLPPRVR